MSDPKSSNVAELEETLAQLSLMSRLEKIDAARVQAARSMAEALDRDPGNASLWRQYRELVKELTAGDDGSLDSELAGLFADMGDSPSS